MILGPGRSPGGGHGNPLQCSSLENPMDRGAWQARVHRVTKSQTRLEQSSTAQHTTFESNLPLHSYQLFLFLATPCAACGISVPQPEVEPKPSAERVWSPNYWTVRKFLSILDIKFKIFKKRLSHCYFNLHFQLLESLSIFSQIFL